MGTLEFFMIFITCSFATQTIVYPIADTYLDSGNPDTNYGSASDLYAFKDVYGFWSYFDLITMFNVTNLPSRVNSATIKYVQEFLELDELLGPYIVFDVYQIATNWTETGATWNNYPTTIKKIASNYQDNDVNNVIWDGTSVVNDAKTTGHALVSFRLHSEYPAVCVFSKENSIQYRAAMIVNY